MATTTGNPWISATAETVTDKPFFCKRMVWYPTTTGDDISVTDNGGNVIWSYKAIAADSNGGIPYELEIDTVLNGLVVATIDHGSLYIYVR